MTPQEYEYLSAITKAYANSPGDILIAGTAHGEDARTMRTAAPNKTIIVIDSFNGLAQPAPEDLAEDCMVAGECNIGGVEAYMDTFKGTGVKPPDETYEMWITTDNLQRVPLRPLCIMFLDLDHYIPTKACLDVFSKCVIDGGIIVVHDYDFVRCPGIKKCCDEFGGRWVKIEGTGLARYYPDDFKLEVGSGVCPNPGYIHLDINKDCPHLEICASADNIPIDSGIVTNLLCINTLEHIEWPSVKGVLSEWARVIAKGGTLAIHVPDMMWLVKFLQSKDDFWKKDVGAQPFNAANDKWEYMNHYIMSTNAPYNMHRSVYTQKFLENILSELGFGNFVRLHTDPRWLYLQATKE